MQRLGRVLHLSQGRNVIVRIKDPPKIGAMVVDENLKPVGKILDVFGPVSSPYASVKPATSETKELMGKTLYILPSKKGRRKVWK